MRTSRRSRVFVRSIGSSYALLPPDGRLMPALEPVSQYGSSSSGTRSLLQIIRARQCSHVVAFTGCSSPLPPSAIRTSGSAVTFCPQTGHLGRPSVSRYPVAIILFPYSICYSYKKDRAIRLGQNQRKEIVGSIVISLHTAQRPVMPLMRVFSCSPFTALPLL